MTHATTYTGRERNARRLAAYRNDEGDGIASVRVRGRNARVMEAMVEWNDKVYGANKYANPTGKRMNVKDEEEREGGEGGEPPTRIKMWRRGGGPLPQINLGNILSKVGPAG